MKILRNYVCWLSLLAIAIFVIETKGQNMQNGVDPKLTAEIAKIKIFDHHAHPVRALKGDEVDDECDPLSFGDLDPFVSPTRLRPDNPEYIGAWRALYGYRYNDMSDAHVAELGKRKREIMQKHGEGYPAWVLDQVGIESMMANRIRSGHGLVSPRFHWIGFVDALLFPLKNTAISKTTPDAEKFIASENRLFQRYLADLQLTTPPATLAEYLKRVVTPTIEKMKQEGSVAVKFEVAYLRPLDFSDVSESDAAQVYNQYIKGSEPPAAEYKKLQDFLFRYIAREAGRLGLPVNLHTGAGGGGYYSGTGGNPLLLESVLNDPTLRKTNFVLIHGGWPFIKETTFLLSKPNVYVDFSVQQFLTSTRVLSETLRSWLDFAPEKVMFGSDAFALTPEVNWEETSWLAVQTGRKALAMTLTSMIKDGQIDHARALEVARMVMRENVITLYGLKN